MPAASSSRACRSSGIRAALAFMPCSEMGSMAARTSTPTDAIVAHHGSPVAACSPSTAAIAAPSTPPISLLAALAATPATDKLCAAPLMDSLLRSAAAAAADELPPAASESPSVAAPSPHPAAALSAARPSPALLDRNVEELKPREASSVEISTAPAHLQQDRGLLAAQLSLISIQITPPRRTHLKS